MLRQRRYSDTDGPRVYGTANEGGGTRKTGSAVNLAVELARRGLKTGLLDGDQTMAASCYLGYGVTDRKKYPTRVDELYARLDQMPNVYDVLHGRASLVEAMVPARTRTVEIVPDQDDPKQDGDDRFEAIPNLRLVLGSRSMSQASADLRDFTKAKAGVDDYWLRRAIAALPAGELDVLIVDTRGTFDSLEISIMAGLDHVIGCVKPDRRDDDTLTNLKDFLGMCARRFEFSGGSADLDYVLVNGRSDWRGKFYERMADDILGFYGNKALPPITEAVTVAESVDAQEPVLYWLGRTSKPAREFAAVADRLIEDAPDLKPAA